MPPRRYLVERYLPGLTAAELPELAARLATAATEAGEDVLYLGSTFLADEESCFCQFEASSADAVERACARAGIPFARVRPCVSVAAAAAPRGGTRNGP
jgi:hypothetical protein